MTRIAAAIAVIVALGLVAWVGGELHYRNCLADVELRHGPAKVDKPVTPVAGLSAEQAAAVENTLDEQNDPARYQALDACSRVPF